MKKNTISSMQKINLCKSFIIWSLNLISHLSRILKNFLSWEIRTFVLWCLIYIVFMFMFQLVASNEAFVLIELPLTLSNTNNDIWNRETCVLNRVSTPASHLIYWFYFTIVQCLEPNKDQTVGLNNSGLNFTFHIVPPGPLNFPHPR